MKYLQMHSSGDDALVAPLFAFIETFGDSEYESKRNTDDL